MQFKLMLNMSNPSTNLHKTEKVVCQIYLAQPIEMFTFKFLYFLQTIPWDMLLMQTLS